MVLMCSQGENHCAMVLLGFGHLACCSLTWKASLPSHSSNSCLFSGKSSPKPWLGSVALLCAPRLPARTHCSIPHNVPVFGLSFYPIRLYVRKKCEFISLKLQLLTQCMVQGRSLINVCWINEGLNTFMEERIRNVARLRILVWSFPVPQSP